MVIWVVGLSGSGKTTLGNAIYGLWKNDSPNTVFIDGDEVRRIFGQDDAKTSYTMVERKKNADRICELCAWLDRQGINVVCCILSMFEQSRQWNRKTYSKYFEVFIDVPMEIIRRRETKGVYERALSGEIANVAGVDLPFHKPEHPDYVFANTQDRHDFSNVAREILTKAKERIERMQPYPYASGSLLDHPNTYFYCAYGGTDFLKSWKSQREDILARLASPSSPPPAEADAPDETLALIEKEGSTINSRDLLESVYRRLTDLTLPPSHFNEIKVVVDRLVKRFELSKRWYPTYCSGLRIRKEEEEDRRAYSDLGLYLRAAEIFEIAYAHWSTLPYLNVLLKSIDTLCAVSGALDHGQRRRLARLILVEGRTVEAVARSVHVSLEAI